MNTTVESMAFKVTPADLGLVSSATCCYPARGIAVGTLCDSKNLWLLGRNKELEIGKVLLQGSSLLGFSKSRLK